MSIERTSKKRLLFVISSLRGGGAERVMVNIMNHLDKNKYDILLVLLENIQVLREDLDSGVEVISLDKKSKFDLVNGILKLRKIMSSYRPDTVLGFLNYANIIIILAGLFKRREFKIYFSERSHPTKLLLNTRFGYLKRLLKRFAYPKADKIITVTKEIESVLKDEYKIPPPKLKTIYNPLSINDVNSKMREDVKHPFLDDKRLKVIIGAGRLVEIKRYDRLLKAFNSVRKRYENARLIILGEGELESELKQLAQRIDIDKYVDFVGFKNNPYSWIVKADIFVLSSDSEGFPNVLIEAMACGIPVIATDCPSGPKEIITNGKNGILVPLEDGNKLGDAIYNLLMDEDLKKKLSEEGIRRSKDFRIENILPQYEDLF